METEYDPHSLYKIDGYMRNRHTGYAERVKMHRNVPGALVPRVLAMHENSPTVFDLEVARQD